MGLIRLGLAWFGGCNKLDARKLERSQSLGWARAARVQLGQPVGRAWWLEREMLGNRGGEWEGENFVVVVVVWLFQ